MRVTKRNDLGWGRGEGGRSRLDSQSGVAGREPAESTAARRERNAPAASATACATTGAASTANGAGLNDVHARDGSDRIARVRRAGRSAGFPALGRLRHEGD